MVAVGKERLSVAGWEWAGLIVSPIKFRKALAEYNQRAVKETHLAVAIVAASASMVTGMFGMWINASQTGKRIDDMGKRFVDLRVDFRELRNEVKDFRTEFNAFREMVNGKLESIDFEIAKLMDRPK